MNKEEILNKYIDLINKGYCCDCNELNCIDNFPHAKITHAIRELQQQNQKYKELIDKVINELFNLKDIIYNPETREETIDIQRKISSIIKDLKVKEVE